MRPARADGDSSFSLKSSGAESTYVGGEVTCTYGAVAMEVERLAAADCLLNNSRARAVKRDLQVGDEARVEVRAAFASGGCSSSSRTGGDSCGAE